MSLRVWLLLAGMVLPAAWFLNDARSSGDGGWTVFASQDLEIISGQRRFRVQARSEQGVSYYRLRDVAEALNLKLQESQEEVRVEGPRGRLVLSAGRRLIGHQDGDILVSHSPWNRRRGDWYVSEDFLEKALPFILNRNLERIDGRAFRVEAIPQTRVEIRVANNPDHVAIVFISDHRLSPAVRDLGDYLQVEFDGFQIVTVSPQTEPDKRLVSAIEYPSGGRFGGFRIRKGPDFHSFREFQLSDPDRKVLYIYAPPVEPASTRPVVAAAVDSPVIELAPLDAAVDNADPRAPPGPPRRVPRNVITIDPGHGGGNIGVQTGTDPQEKTIAFRVSALLEKLLNESETSAVLSRNRDLDLPLEQRSAVGNYYQSRAFVSIHTGGAPSPQTSGPVVYIHRPAARASAAAFGETEQSGSPSRDNPDASDRFLVSWEQAQRSHLGESRRLASMLQNELNTLFGSRNRVVEVPIEVLAPVAGPAVLIEAGFLTNSEDREKLSSPVFQEQLARAIATSLQRFLRTPGEGP